MLKSKSVLGIVPARGNSQRLPGKNIACAAGKPLLAWTVEAGLKSTIVDKVVLTTDDPEISSVGIRFGVDEVLDRPKSLARHDTSMYDVISQVLEVFKERGEHYGYFALLQPTSPLRTAKNIDQAFELIERHNGTGAVSVYRTKYPLQWMGRLSPDGFLDSFIQDTELDGQSRNFGTGYQINGAIYIAQVDKFTQEQTIFLKTGMVAYIMEPSESVDIDDEYDFRLASWLLTGRKEKENSN